ncbi:HD domain-containing protein [Agromyces mediolanus]|uniref:HD domain-containing protein n=1 Tax=Agromyces mediolanus TaxID=41986 RepID=UPI00203FC6F8|nr:HD domain-containing protein [Agromyces mediolanus]MCM3658855.1 HD domain-containing protein [Agromyces mediolanus]
MSRAPDTETGAALLRIAAEASIPSGALRDAGLIDAVPELAALATTPQDPQWHPEGDVLVHSLDAADRAARLADELSAAPDRRRLLMLGALLHDVGKPATTRERAGRITSLGHAEHGGTLVRELGARLGWPGSLVEPLAALVETHMAHVSVQGEPTRRAVRRLRTRLEAAGTTLADWAVVVRCDGEARGAAARPDASIPWLRVAAELD